MITVDFSRELRKQGQFVHTTAENLVKLLDSLENWDHQVQNFQIRMTIVW